MMGYNFYIKRAVCSLLILGGGAHSAFTLAEPINEKESEGEKIVSVSTRIMAQTCSAVDEFIGSYVGVNLGEIKLSALNNPSKSVQVDFEYPATYRFNCDGAKTALFSIRTESNLCTIADGNPLAQKQGSCSKDGSVALVPVVTYLSGETMSKVAVTGSSLGSQVLTLAPNGDGEIVIDHAYISQVDKRALQPDVLDVTYKLIVFNL